MSDGNQSELPRKRRRLGDDENNTIRASSHHKTLNSSVSPPPTRRIRETPRPKLVPSPFQLTWIRDLPESSNVDAISLKDILGDPLIAECWEFNYLHDLDYLMDAFDSDVKDLVKVHVVHGFWKEEDTSRQNLIQQASKYRNITLHTAYMPEMFGTHHSKMLIVVRHDDTAQVIIHTANMIAFDWTNMTQAVWRSPLLPKLASNAPRENSSEEMGSGGKFKTDLMNYLKAYDTKRIICKSLIAELAKYDFSAIRAALVASVPGRQNLMMDSKTSWGWVGLKNVLDSVPVEGNEPEIVVQISSIATLGPNDKWLDKTLFKSLNTSKNQARPKSTFRIIFPTPEEVRKSLNGYSSGNAIHTKIQSPQQVKQLEYLKPLFTHWAGDILEGGAVSTSDAGRKRAAPHIKTYVRFTDKTRSSIDWMLVTSANLSKQAWGEATNSAGEVRVSSYEIGVMVWPELYGEGSIMIPTFKTDTPPADLKTEKKVLVGARMPYDFPLVPYGKDEVPWVATASYTEFDWRGETWNVG